jgi:hypothetical protein
MTKTVPVTAVDSIHRYGPDAVWETEAGYRRPFRRDLPPGAIVFSCDDQVLTFTCPCGCGAVHGVPVTSRTDMHSWEWNGNKEKPTLTPSLGLHPKQATGGYHWHGYLTDGVFIEC